MSRSVIDYSRRIGLVVALLVGTGGLLVSAAPTAFADPGPTVSPTNFVAYETGAGSINDTAGAWDVGGTDLGISWDDNQGHVLVAYGDTFGAPYTAPAQSSNNAPVGGDWRSNVLAVSSDHDLADGMSFDSMVTDSTGHAKELISSLKQTGVEQTVIPTAGIAVGTRQYMAYMSVKQWGSTGGVWTTNYSGIAYSDDDGQTWVKDAVTWPNNASGTDPFQQAAFVHRDGYVYMFGTQNGRFGPAYVSRVPENSVLDKSAYQYWTGSAWQTGADTIAATVVSGTVAELSVQYNDYLGKYLMMYIDPTADALVLRQADSPQGPWSDETIVQQSSEYSSMYGGFMHPWSTGRDLYFSMSEWRPYNTFLMHVTLSGGTGNPTPDVQNAVSDGGFESATSPWQCLGQCGIDSNGSNQHSGVGNGWVRNDTGWNDIHQTVSVQPNTTYQLSGWLRTSDNSDNGFFGLRTTGGTVLGEAHYTNLYGYQHVTVDVNTGANSSVVVYGGVWTNDGDIWLQIDDVTLFPVS
ncbi:MAG: DUF4185 domain-containing protein [Actinobacteria bacterium]|nr:DUF4185 domain-containing protein [Actinomycetota bacterium]